MGIKENLFNVRERINQAKRNSPYRQSVVLVGVTKGVQIGRVGEAVSAGLEVIGENRIQEAREKVQTLGRTIRWHMVGHLQRNKVREAIQLFELIHSVDTLSLAQEIEKEAARLQKEVPILLQVKGHGRETQFGAEPEKVRQIAKEIAELHHVQLVGLMTIAPLSEDAEKCRPYFRRLRELKEAVEKEKDLKVDMRYLSMGMSNDFEIAVEEGSNMVRIGRALFG